MFINDGVAEGLPLPRSLLETERLHSRRAVDPPLSSGQDSYKYKQKRITAVRMATDGDIRPGSKQLQRRVVQRLLQGGYGSHRNCNIGVR